MGNHWPKVKLGDVLRRSEETINLQPDANYREVTVKLWGKGVVLRGIVTGADVAAFRRAVARQGQFILSRIDARNGAMGIVPSELDGAIISNDFPVFDVATDRLLPGYMGWICKTAAFVEICQQASEGTTNRVRLQEDKFLATEVALPPILEQQRIVARIDELTARIKEAQALSCENDDARNGLMSAFLNSIFESKLSAKGCLLRPLPEVATIARGKFGHRPRNDPRFYGGQFPFIQIGDISDSKRCIRAHSQSLNEQGLAISRIFPAGTVVIAITGATIGVTGILTFDSCFPDSIVGIQAKSDVITPEFVYLGVEHAKKSALSEATQTTQPNINLRNLERLQVRVPSLDEQQEIVNCFDELERNLLELEASQISRIGELDALTPSILDKAFRGEL